MKKLFAISAFSVLFACNTAEDKNDGKAGGSASTNSGEELSYPVRYSSKFEMGDSKKSETILSLWRYFDNNTLDSSIALFADSVTMEFPGTIMSGPRDTIMAMTKSYRDGFAKVTSVVDAIISTRSTDKNADWVCVWGMETKTDKQGKTDSLGIHEIWRFNKDGKIDYMSQFVQQPAAKQ